MIKSGSKFQVILMIVFGAFAVGGVLIFAFAVGGVNTNSVGVVQVWGTLEQSAFNAIIRQVSETTPSLSGVKYTQKDETTYERELTAALASGTGPDIFIIRTDRAMRDAGQVWPIPFTSMPQEQFKASFVEAADSFVSQNLGVIAIPMLVDPLVLYWNKDLIQAAGHARPPVYWDEVYKMATYLDNASAEVNKSAVTIRDQNNAIKKSTIAFGEYRNVRNAKDILATLIMQAGGEITALDNNNYIAPALVTQSGVSGSAGYAAQSALRFFTDFADPTKNYYSWNRSLPDSRDAFAAGDVALYVGYASELPFIKKANPNLNFAVAAMPQIRDTKPLTFAHVYGYAISKTGRRPTAAAVAASLLANTSMSATFSTVYGIPSARRDVLSAPATGEAELFNRAALIARSWIDPDPIRTGEMFRGMIEQRTSGAVDVSEAVQRADQELAQILRQ